MKAAFAERVVFPLVVEKLNRSHMSADLRVPHHQLVWLIIEELMSAALGFQHEGESRVAPNNEPFDRIHLKCGAQLHISLRLEQRRA